MVSYNHVESQTEHVRREAQGCGRAGRGWEVRDLVLNSAKPPTGIVTSACNPGCLCLCVGETRLTVTSCRMVVKVK